ncbi:hypothetical protein FC80_GL001079 [Liquorilactobacillus cacaonum DSM 21116]|uniref:Uncharacterized protein n=1 Tax=Liquorilactobacillus cacaonum DSM 21116 TaxID=1423729 RepID=A0A0R2CS17_9LACO|nr:hypothetical protein FC80_GL001079 [Liquorilactobacillus cacaonum DSM 21116]
MEIHSNNAKKEADYIFEQTKKHFKPHVRARYYILVVNDRFDSSYNFFFNIFKPRQLSRSIPMRRLMNQTLEYLEEVIGFLRQKTTLTFIFILFEDQRWPSNNKLISNKKRYQK